MIKCLASGFPTRSIKWKRLGKTIGDQALYFNSFKRSVGGVYLCEAYDQAGKDSKEIIVRVNDSPELEFPTKQKGKFHILFANLWGGLVWFPSHLSSLSLLFLLNLHNFLVCSHRPLIIYYLFLIFLLLGRQQDHQRTYVLCGSFAWFQLLYYDNTKIVSASLSGCYKKQIPYQRQTEIGVYTAAI